MHHISAADCFKQKLECIDRGPAWHVALRALGGATRDWGRRWGRGTVLPDAAFHVLPIGKIYIYKNSTEEIYKFTFIYKHLFKNKTKTDLHFGFGFLALFFPDELVARDARLQHAAQIIYCVPVLSHPEPSRSKRGRRAVSHKSWTLFDGLTLLDFRKVGFGFGRSSSRLGVGFKPHFCFAQ